MRADFKIALLSAVASIPAGMAVSAAFEHFSFLKGHSELAFYASAGLTLLLLAAAALIALRAEQAAERSGAKKRMLPLVGMIVFGAAFLGCSGWYLWPSTPAMPRPQDRWTWSALTESDIDMLFAKLRDKPRASIHIACNRTECTALADSFDSLFKRLGWPSFIGDGGIFAMGVTGLSIAPRDKSAEALKEAIETITVLRPSLGSPRDVGTTHPIMLVIGTKPTTMPSGPLVATPDAAKSSVAPPPPPLKVTELPVGSLRYVVFIADTVRSTASKKTSVQMIVEMRNATDRLMYFKAVLQGNVGGKPSPNGAIKFEGNIPAGDTRRMLYDRIFDVPVNEESDSRTPAMSGLLDYDITYWVDPSPQKVERQTAKRVEFSMWRPFEKTPPPSGEVRFETTVRLSNEIEK